MFNIFKKKKKDVIGWNTLPIKYLKLITSISNDTTLSEDDKILKITALINNISYEELVNLSLEKTTELIKTTNFLYTKPKNNKSVRNLNLNGKDYEIIKDINDISTAQFIDYNSLIGNYDDNIAELLSIFIVPQGHKYNTNYDIKDVVNDINEYMTVEEGLSLSNFFIKQYKRYITHSLLYLETILIAMNKRKLNQITKQRIEKKITELKEVQTKISSLVG
jgi:hypothetical protein